MELQLFKTLWGHSGSLAQAADEAIKSGFIGLEGNADLTRARRDELLAVLQLQYLDYIQ
ncbi:MAG TPA: hypothetical protein PLU16_11805 [Gallionellaceae bacterium]|nr:hypothetical protein [Gallionellaceae bacterium]HQS75892.1 hypothetical protein [Gallionellaceae bacterium]